MKETNKKIIEVIIERAKQKCPKSLDLIGIYGSVCTGDEHQKSDLDLLILINDENGWQLSDGFILDDEQIGYDIYCTSWQMLEEDAECHHAHISKLMDSKIVYAADESVIERLDRLKERANKILRTEERYERAEEVQDQIRKVYADAMTEESIGEMRVYAAYMISLSLDLVMLWNGKYFKKGVKRTFEELEGLHLPESFRENIQRIIYAKKGSEISHYLTALLRTIISFTKQEKEKAEPSKEALAGTYEEMFSNWKNKMSEAAESDDVFSSFMNMASLQVMLKEISNEMNIADIDCMGDFSSENLKYNVTIFDNTLKKYLNEYEKVGMEPKHFKNVDSFAGAYLSKSNL